jgi:F-type H+-transporting ATPase subunit epsilon
MATLHFDLVSPERVLFSGELDAVLLPGEEGEMTVLPGHAPVMTVLKAGFVVMTGSGHTGSRVLVRGGFAEINPTGVTVLAERATAIEDLTPESIEREILSIRTRRDGSDDEEVRRSADALIAQLEEARATLQF